MRKFLLPLLLALALPAFAQNFLSVTASQIYGGGGMLLPSGQISFQPVDANGNVIGYQVGGGGQQITFPTVCAISGGALLPGCLLPNVSLTNPMNVCFAATVKDGSNTVIVPPSAGYTCVQPQTANYWCAAGACNFDQFIPNSPNYITARLGTPQTLSLGGVYAFTCPTNQVANGVLPTGNLNCVAGGGGGGTGVWGAITGTLSAQLDLQAALNLKVPTSTTVNGHSFTNGNITISASDLTIGTLPHAQLPPLISSDIPNNSANTTGLAAGLSSGGTIAGLPSGCLNIVAGVIGSTGTGCASGSGAGFPTGTGFAIVASGVAWGTTLADPLATSHGGTGTAGALTGFVRGGSPFTAAEVSGDCSTSGGFTITCTKSNSVPFGTGAFVAIANYVPITTTVNTHALSTNIVISASDLTTGTLPHAQLPTLLSGDIPNNAANTSGTAGGLSANITESQVTNLVSDLAGKVPTTTTVNGHALSSNVTVSASDLTTGTLPHAQLPTLLSGDIPNNAANTSGNAATSTALAAVPTACSLGAAARGVDASGNATGCFTPAGGVATVTASAPLASSGGGNPNITLGALTAGSNGLANSAVVDATNAGNISTGTLPHGRLPALLSADIPNNAANTSGTAANLSGTPALPNGTTCQTQLTGDSSTKCATDQFVLGQGFLTTNAVASVFGRTGAIAANTGDYSYTQVTGAGNTLSSTLTTGFLPRATGAAAQGNSLLDEGITHANGLNVGDTAGIFATGFTGTGGTTGIWTIGCGGTTPNLVSGISFSVLAGGCASYVLLMPNAPGSGYMQVASNVPSAGYVSVSYEPAINLGSGDVAGNLGLANGGTGATSASGAANNILPTPVRKGDIPWWNGSAWTTLPGCQTSTCIPAELGNGNLFMLQTPIPVSDGGTGTTTPALVAGSGISVTGTWPNQTITNTGGGGGGGGVSSITGDNTLFNNSASTGAVTLTQANAGGGTLFGNNGTVGAVPAFTIAPVLGIPGTSTGTLALATATNGKFTLTPPNTSNTPTITLPTNSNVLTGQVTGDGLNISSTPAAADATGNVTLARASIAAFSTLANNTNASATPTVQPYNCQLHYKPASLPLTDQITASGSFATTLSIPATCLASGTRLEIRAHGVYTTTSTASPVMNLRVDAGGTTGICPASTSAQTLTTSVNNGFWDAVCYIQIDSVGSNTATAWGTWQINTTAGTSGANKTLNFVNASTGTVSYTATGSQTASVTETATFVTGQTMNLTALDAAVIQ